ncbi:MAG: choice-of-anchor Q domain-containing protein [Gemmatimonadota bacterium]
MIGDGAATMGGGILNRGTLTLTDVTMTGHGATAGSGGAIFTDAGSTLHVSGSRFESSQASDRGGAIWVDLGATLTMTNSVLLSNTATQGGGIFSFHGILGLEYVSIRNNSAQNGNGGGVNNSGGSLVLSGSAIATNVAQARGGGLYSAGPAGSTIVSIVNSTITGNIAQGTGGAPHFGGGVAGESGTISFYNATIVDNTSASGGGSGVHRVVTGQWTGATFDFRNTIVVGHRILGHSACSGGPAGFVSNGHNLDEDNTCNFIVNSDLPGGNANLSLAATLNGGTTESHSLQIPGDAIDAGDQSACQANPVNGGDQRGFGRSDGMCDIGAFEFQALAG